MTPEAETFRTERWPTTVSIGIFLRYDARSYGLLLVRNQNQWGLPAGGLQKGEYFMAGIRRELAEETGIVPGKTWFNPLIPTTVICLPQEDRTQLGLVFQATYHGPHLSRTGWPVRETKVGYAKPFSLPDLVKLAQAQLTADNKSSAPIYKPHFNLPLIIFWLAAHQEPRYIRKFFQKHPRLEGLHQNETRWSYQPPYLTGTQDFEAEMRQLCLRWGP